MYYALRKKMSIAFWISLILSIFISLLCPRRTRASIFSFFSLDARKKIFRDRSLLKSKTKIETKTQIVNNFKSISYQERNLI